MLIYLGISNVLCCKGYYSFFQHFKFNVNIWKLSLSKVVDWNCLFSIIVLVYYSGIMSNIYGII